MNKSERKAQARQVFLQEEAARRARCARTLLGAERLCVRCEHFEIHWYFEYDDTHVEMRCHRAQFVDAKLLATEDLRKVIRRADDCDAYSEPPA